MSYDFYRTELIYDTAVVGSSRLARHGKPSGNDGGKERRMGDQRIYKDGLLLAVFFQNTLNETDHLYVSLDGMTFKKIGVPYATEDKAATGIYRRSFRDPGMMYRDGKLWILNGDVVEGSGSTPNRYQPKWGVSTDLVKWSKVLSGNTTGAGNNPVSLAIGNPPKYPYDKDGKMSNTKFDAWGPDLFVDGNDIYMFLSAGYWSETHQKDYEGVDDGLSWGERDAMKQYLIKIKKLSMDSAGNLQADYEPAKMVNFPEVSGVVDERKVRRKGKEDRIDGSMYKENGYYYFAIKRYGTSYELWRIKDLNKVSDAGSWTLINSDFVYEYEGASLVKFKGKYLLYCDQLSDRHGIYVAMADGLGADQKWKVPQKVLFVEAPGTEAQDISRRHGTVLHITDRSQIDAVLKVYEAKYGTAPYEALKGADMQNGWFRSNGKLYNRHEGVERKSCEYQEDGHWYWFDADGSMAKNKHVYIPNLDKWVYYTHTGKMAKGELYIGNDHIYWDNSPQSEFHWYYFDLITGERAVSKFVHLEDNDRWVYYDSHGWMVYGEQQINGNWYYFDPVNGKMAKGNVTMPDGSQRYYDETTGIWLR